MNELSVYTIIKFNHYQMVKWYQMVEFACKPKAHPYVSGLFIAKIHITAMRLIIFLTIHLIIMAKSTISYIITYNIGVP